MQSILITGASSGIGLTSARVLKARGWRVLATARKSEDIAMLENDVGVEALYLDLADETSIAACAEETLTRTDGKILALFNNGAYGQVGAIEDLPVDLLRHQFQVNLFGTHELTRLLIPAMRKQQRGRIVQNSSVLGLMSAPYRGAYCATKFALEALSDALHLELQGTGIHVSLIEPGPIRTRFVESALAHFRTSVDINASPHQYTYVQRLAAMEQGGKSTFKLEPEAVAKKLVHALESANPRRRYPVTVPTYLAVWANRLFPQIAKDWLAQRV